MTRRPQRNDCRQEDGQKGQKGQKGQQQSSNMNTQVGQTYRLHIAITSAVKASIRATTAVLQAAWLDAHERRLTTNAPGWAFGFQVIMVCSHSNPNHCRMSALSS